VENISFAWFAIIFKQFSFFNLLHENETGACTSIARLRSFCDPLTLTEISSFLYVFVDSLIYVLGGQIRLQMNCGRVFSDRSRISGTF
jgi:hypothetical protein